MAFMFGFFHALQSKLVRAVLVVFYAWFFVFYPIYCRNNCVCSLYFPLWNNMASTHEAVVRQQRYLGRKADTYLATLDAKENLAFYQDLLKTDEKLLLILIITSDRKRENYLRRTIAKVDQQIKRIDADDKRSIPSLLVCEVEPANVTFPKVNEQFRAELQRSMKVIKDRFVFFTPKTTRKKTIIFKLAKQKETADYHSCIEEATQTYPSKYVLVMEDDAEPEPESIRKVMQLIHASPWPRHDWLLTKLYSSDRQKGFALNEPFKIVELIVATTVLGWILTYLVTLVCQTKKMRQIKFWSYLFCLLELLLLGRQHTVLLLWETVAPSFMLEKAPAAYTTAVLYQAAQLPHLLSHLARSTGQEIPLDEIIHLYLQDEAGKPGYYVPYTRFFRHIGLQSSLHGRNVFTDRFFYLPELGQLN